MLMYSRCSVATTKTNPATLAAICSRMMGWARRSAMMPQSAASDEHGVVDEADVAAAPGAHAAAAGPEDVGNRAHERLGEIELGLEEQPRAENRDRAGEERALAGADAAGERGADAQAADVGASRQERHVEQRRQDHPGDRADEEHAPLVGADDAPPAAPSRQGCASGVKMNPVAAS